MYGSSKVYPSRPDVLARSARSPTQTFSDAAPGKGLNHIPSQDHTMCVCVPPSYTVSLCIGHCQHTVTQIIKPHTNTKSYNVCVHLSHIQSIPSQNHTLCVYTFLISRVPDQRTRWFWTRMVYLDNMTMVYLNNMTMVYLNNMTMVYLNNMTMVYLDNMTMVYLNNMTMVYLDNMTMVYLDNMTMVYLNKITHLRNTILVWNPQRNGMSQQYDTLEKYHSGTEPST